MLFYGQSQIGNTRILDGWLLLKGSVINNINYFSQDFTQPDNIRKWHSLWSFSEFFRMASSPRKSQCEKELLAIYWQQTVLQALVFHFTSDDNHSITTICVLLKNLMQVLHMKTKQNSVCVSFPEQLQKDNCLQSSGMII